MATGIATSACSGASSRSKRTPICTTSTGSRCATRASRTESETGRASARGCSRRSGTRGLLRADPFGLHEPEGALAALDAPPAVDPDERRREHARRLAVDRRQRALHAAEPNRVAPCPHEAVQLESGPAPVEPGVFGAEERLV